MTLPTDRAALLGPLYGPDGSCKLCGEREARTGLHPQYSECPGRLLEALQLELRYSGRRCPSGCCGYAEGTLRGLSLEELIKDAASDCEGTVSVTATLRWTATVGDYSDAVVEASKVPGAIQ